MQARQVAEDGRGCSVQHGVRKAGESRLEFTLLIWLGSFMVLISCYWSLFGPAILFVSWELPYGGGEPSGRAMSSSCILNRF